MIPVTGSQVRKGGLEPMMDARAAGMAEHRVLINLTPEVDSLVEWVASLGRRYQVPGDELRKGLAYCRQAIDLNNTQDAHLGDGLEWADQIIRDAEDAARNSGAPAARSIKQLAVLLRPALRVIAAQRPLPHLSIHRAHCLVGDVIASESSERLLSSTMQVQLGCKPFGLLCELHAEHKQETAA